MKTMRNPVAPDNYQLRTDNEVWHTVAKKSNVQHLTAETTLSHISFHRPQLFQICRYHINYFGHSKCSYGVYGINEHGEHCRFIHPCIYYNSRSGCPKGDSCIFPHIRPDDVARMWRERKPSQTPGVLINQVMQKSRNRKPVVALPAAPVQPEPVPAPAPSVPVIPSPPTPSGSNHSVPTQAPTLTFRNIAQAAAKLPSTKEPTKAVASLRAAYIPIATSDKNVFCLRAIRYNFDRCNNESCRMGVRCNFAHSAAGIEKQSHFAALDNMLLSRNKRIPFQAIYDALYTLLSDKSKELYDLHARYSKEFQPELLSPSKNPADLRRMLRTWAITRNYAKTHLNNNERYLLQHFTLPTVIDGVSMSDLASAIISRGIIDAEHGYCGQDFDLAVKKVMAGQFNYNLDVNAGKEFAESIKDSRLTVCCKHTNCLKGSHLSAYNDKCASALIVFCMKELCNGTCNCAYRTVEAVNWRRDELKGDIIDLRKKLAMSKKSEQETLRSQIEAKAKELVLTVYRIHLVSDYGYAPLVAPTFLQAEITSSTFEAPKPETDHSINPQEEEALRALFLQRREEQRKLTLEKCEKERIYKEQIQKASTALLPYVMRRVCKHRVNQLRMASPEDRPLMFDFYGKKANLYMSFAEYKADVAGMNYYANWLEYSSHMNEITYPDFVIKARSQIKFFNGMSEDDKIAVDTVEKDKALDSAMSDLKERINPRDPSLYRNFWTWLADIPLTDDLKVVGTAGEYVTRFPDLFQEYCAATAPKYSVAFSDWIVLPENDHVTRCIALCGKTDSTYSVAKKYLRLECPEKWLNFPTFVRTADFSLCCDFVSINNCKKALEGARFVPLSFKTYSMADSNKQDAYWAYYVQSASAHYSSFEEFCSSIADGWKFSFKPSTKVRKGEIVRRSVPSGEKSKSKNELALETETNEFIAKLFKQCGSHSGVSAQRKVINSMHMNSNRRSLFEQLQAVLDEIAEEEKFRKTIKSRIEKLNSNKRMKDLKDKLTEARKAVSDAKALDDDDDDDFGQDQNSESNSESESEPESESDDGDWMPDPVEEALVPSAMFCTQQDLEAEAETDKSDVVAQVESSKVSRPVMTDEDREALYRKQKAAKKAQEAAEKAQKQVEEMALRANETPQETRARHQAEKKAAEKARKEQANALKSVQVKVVSAPVASANQKLPSLKGVGKKVFDDFE